MKLWLHDWLLRHWYGEWPIWVLIPSTWVFVILTTLRRGLYRVGILLPGSLPVPVIVIGNINIGGSGKTPFTLWLCRVLREAGYKPGIITRGYGGKSRRWPQLATADSDPREVGDEAVLLAGRSGVPVAVGQDRIAAATLLIERHKLDLILSDDGLQHYRLPRRVEIIMLDGRRGLGNGWRLPAGPLREAAGRLQEADFVVVKNGETLPDEAPADAVHMRLELTGAVSLADGSHRRLEDFAGQRVHAVAGIADPDQFFAALAAHGLRADGRALPDHAAPDPRALVFDDELPVFMTEKDAVKCKAMRLENHWYVTAEADIGDTDRARLLPDLITRLMHHPD
ncbi:MAG TPA: tetraacyldisaccharide 4'-kinase [Gammaproteobacteria bacterium]|nr:tetraacyldisaccharide 4'-kinase [Gammaproteobacteria bacterium]